MNNKVSVKRGQLQFPTQRRAAQGRGAELGRLGSDAVPLAASL